MSVVDDITKRRFWSKVDQSPGHGPKGTCWKWKAAPNSSGYGRLAVRGVRHYAHRLSYSIHHGAVPDGKFVCHHCDNRVCVNPHHLFAGTHTDNMRDMWAKGRGDRVKRPRGERNGTSKLSEGDVVAMRRDRSEGATLSDLARRFGVTESNASSICRGKTWTHAGGPVSTSRSMVNRARGGRTGSAKLSETAVRRIRERASRGVTYKAIASEYGVAAWTISNVVRRRTWAHVE